jgi:1,2-diacylglycerol 3-beta-galactosyltransferase
MKRVLFLMSDTGGGHRAAAEAIRDALTLRYGEDQISATLIDVFRASRFPMNYMPEFYPWLVNHSKRSWALGYKLSNTRRRADMLSQSMYLTNRRRFKKLFATHPVDVVVSVHSVITRPTLRALYSFPTRPPYLTVVTDLVTTHHFWYDRRTDRCFVPTQAAYDRGLQARMRPEQMRITGLPVDPRFIQRLKGKAEARAELGWDPHLPAVLMVAGGDGMGPLFETARALDMLAQPFQMAVVAGRNKPLKERLDAASWSHPIHTYPFIRNMPTLMAAADILVTKAGPATITEAAIAGLPMILSDAIPGQEDGNVAYVIESQAGAYCPKPALVADTVAQWLNEGPDALRQRSENARRIANPNAVWDIADEVWEWAHHGPIQTPSRSLLRRGAQVLRRRNRLS